MGLINIAAFCAIFEIEWNLHPPKQKLFAGDELILGVEFIIRLLSHYILIKNLLIFPNILEGHCVKVNLNDGRAYMRIRNICHITIAKLIR